MKGKQFFFDKKTDKMFLGHSKTKFKVSPVIIVSKLLYRPALNEELIISPFVLSNVDMITFLKNEKKNIVKSYLIILLAFLLPVLFSIVYLLTSNFLFLFLAILFFMFPLLLLNTKPIQRFKVVHMLDKKYSTKENDI
ncbi:hypothetical protein [Streptococcus sp. Marseille-Q0941]|uniref:hypothetical protein n=1 Tax=Streptococcus sp. Marseille-Q0941 TaxID=2942206 RepID=UPI0020734A62|nr:hypothetical protein [Streptococcus sp. Marseille-Q0941]